MAAATTPVQEALDAARLVRTAYQQALDQFAIFAVTDRRGDIVYANQRFSDLSGYAVEELIGRNHRILNSGHHAAAFFADLWRTVSSGRPWHGEICNRAKGGELYWVDTTIVPLVGADGRPEQYASVRFNITPRKMSEAQLASLLKQLNEKRLAVAKATAVAQAQFLAHMSHELRTPMNGVIGMLDLTLKTDLNPQQAEFLTTAMGSARELLTIVDEILEFSKIESRAVTVESIPFQPAVVIQALGGSFKARAAQKNLRLTWTLTDAVPDWVLGDPTRMRQILINLVGNAVKFTSQGEVAVKIDYSPSDSGGDLAIEVRDTGMGLTKQAQSKIFDRFVQADAGATRRFGGAGLGLATCKNLVELLGGRIGVRSRPGAGSTFWFTVPARATDRPAPPMAQSPSAAAPERPLRLLVADDHPVNRTIMKMYLQIAGHEVTMAEDGAQAVQAVKNRTFDAVFMDIQMPVMDGLTAARRIRALARPACDTPIIAVTANATAEDRERYGAAGMNNCVAKPIEQAALYEALGRIAVPALGARRAEAG